MSKITIPEAEIKLGGALQPWHYDNAMIRSDVVKSRDNGNAVVNGDIDLSIGDVAAILAEGGEVEQYLMAIYAPMAFLDTDVPDPLPNNKTLNGSAVEVLKKFSAWGNTGWEIWKKNDNTAIIAYTNPFAGNEDVYLTGSEISIINDIDPAVDIHTIVWAEIETATGWTKL